MRNICTFLSLRRFLLSVKTCLAFETKCSKGTEDAKAHKFCCATSAKLSALLQTRHFCSTSVAAYMSVNCAITAASANKINVIFYRHEIISFQKTVMEKAVFSWCYLENEEEEKDLFLLFLADSVRSIPDIFCTRGEEGCESMLVQRHLLQDENKFRSFYRLNINQFNFVLGLIENDLKKPSCGLVRPQ